MKKYYLLSVIVFLLIAGAYAQEDEQLEAEFEDDDIGTVSSEPELADPIVPALAAEITRPYDGVVYRWDRQMTVRICTNFWDDVAGGYAVKGYELHAAYEKNNGDYVDVVLDKWASDAVIGAAVSYWKGPRAGTYDVYVMAFDGSGNSFESDHISIEIRK